MDQIWVLSPCVPSSTNSIRPLYGSATNSTRRLDGSDVTNSMRGIYGSGSVTNSLRQDGTLRNIRYRMFASLGSKDVDRDAIIESFWQSFYDEINVSMSMVNYKKCNYTLYHNEMIKLLNSSKHYNGEPLRSHSN